MSMNNILCHNCDKDLGLGVSESFSKDSAKALRKNFIVRFLFIYTDNKDDKFIVCSPECNSALTDKIFKIRGVTQEKIEQIKFLMDIAEKTADVGDTISQIRKYI